MLKLLLITLGIVFISIALLCIRMILIPGSKFRGIHISESPALRKKGIHCVQSMDAIQRKENPYKIRERSK